MSDARTSGIRTDLRLPCMLLGATSQPIPLGPDCPPKRPINFLCASCK